MRTVWGDHERFFQTYFTTYPGRYFTGDGCRRDEDGYYWITGRVDDVINISGHRLGTAEVESALRQLDGVTVDRRRRREDEALDARLARHVGEVHRAAMIDLMGEAGVLLAERIDVYLKGLRESRAAAEKDGDVSQDEAKKGLEKVQKATDEGVKKIDEIVAAKEKEVMQV